MADLALASAGKLHIVDADVHRQCTTRAEVAIVAGQLCSLDATTGKAQLGDSDTETDARQLWFAMRNAAIDEAITLSKECVVDGFVLDDHNFGALMYASNTAGAIADAAASGSNSLIVGSVEPVFGNGGTADKLLRISLP